METAAVIVCVQAKLCLHLHPLPCHCLFSASWKHVYNFKSQEPFICNTKWVVDSRVFFATNCSFSDMVSFFFKEQVLFIVAKKPTSTCIFCLNAKNPDNFGLLHTKITISLGRVAFILLDPLLPPIGFCMVYLLSLCNLSGQKNQCNTKQHHFVPKLRW